jgi:hypothetical protein
LVISVALGVLLEGFVGDENVVGAKKKKNRTKSDFKNINIWQA